MANSAQAKKNGKQTAPRASAKQRPKARDRDLEEEVKKLKGAVEI